MLHPAEAFADSRGGIWSLQVSRTGMILDFLGMSFSMFTEFFFRMEIWKSEVWIRRWLWLWLWFHADLLWVSWWFTHGLMYTPVNEHSRLENGPERMKMYFLLKKSGYSSQLRAMWVYQRVSLGYGTLLQTVLGSLGYVSFQQPEALDASGTVIGRLAPEACSGWVNR